MFIAIGLVTLVGAGIAFLAIAPPVDFIRDQLVSQVKQQTGRDLKINGKAGLSFYPSLGFSMDNVALSPPPGMQGPPFARMKNLTVQVKLLPLLSRKVSIERFVLNQPVFDFRVDKSGRKTWDFASHLKASAPRRYAQASGQGTLNDAGGAGVPSDGQFDVAALEGLELGDVRIVDGKLRYLDETTAAKHALHDIDVTLALKSLDKPFGAEGNITYKREKVEFKAVLGTLKKILSNTPATLDARFKSAHLDGRYKGTVDVSGPLRLDGVTSAKSSSIRNLAHWLGTKLPPATGFGPFSLEGNLKANGPTYQLSKTKLNIDGATGTGDIKVETAAVRPKISGNLRLSVLDLNKYLPPEEGAAAAARPARAQPQTPAAQPAPAGAPASIEDLIEQQPATRVRGYTKRSGWSTEPIDMTGLAAVDAKLALEVGQLLYKKIKVGKSFLNVNLLNSLLTAKLDEMLLYSGTGKGVVTINARRPKPAIAANFNLSNVSAQPLLTDAAEIDFLSGKGRVLLALKTVGGNQAELVKRLNGTANIAFENGAIVGVNVAKSLRALQQGRFDQLSGGASEKTDFSQMTASFKIRNGIASNNDLSILSPLIRVGGEGQIALPQQNVDYIAKPKLVASLSGQGGARDASGLEIPVRIHGPFGNLQYSPDVSGFLSNPGAAADTVRNLGRQLGGDKAGKVIDGLLGGGGQGGGSGTDAKKLLDGFLGGR